MTRILVLPGIGDIYWVMVTLQDFCRQNNLGTPEVWVWDFDGRRRSLEYVERIPFVKAGGYFEAKHRPPEFHESYIEAARSVFPGLFGFDYYLAVNGQLRQGRSIADAMPGLAQDWFFSLSETPAEAKFAEMYGNLWPDGYITAHFSDFGMFSWWARCWPPEACAAYIREVESLTGLPVVLTGSSWDAKYAGEVARLAECVDLSGQTDADQFFALFRHAAGCVGWCGGNTILATAFKVPTQIIWSTRTFPKRAFYTESCPPGATVGPEAWYTTRHCEQTDVVAAAEQYARLFTARRLSGV